MEWVLLTYGVIFGVIGLYLAYLWQRVRRANQQLQQKSTMQAEE